MNTALVLGAIGLTVLGGGYLAYVESDGRLPFLARECEGAAVPSRAPSAGEYHLRLTLHNNVSVEEIRVCMSLGDTKLYDQTYTVGGDVGSYWEVYVVAAPDEFIIDLPGTEGTDLKGLGSYLAMKECQGSVPEFLFSREWMLISVDCVTPSSHFMPPRRPAAAHQPVDQAAFVPDLGGGMAGGPGAAWWAGVAAASITVVLVSRFRAPIKWFVVGLFSRISRPKVLDQAVRNSIYTLVVADPGVHRAEIARRLELGAGQAVHHLALLVREGALAVVANGLGKHYFPRGRLSPDEMRKQVLLRHEAFASMYRAAQEHPGDPLSRIAAAAGKSRPHASRLAHKLADGGLLRLERRGHELRLFPIAVGSAQDLRT